MNEKLTWKANQRKDESYGVAFLQALAAVAVLVILANIVLGLD